MVANKFGWGEKTSRNFGEDQSSRKTLLTYLEPFGRVAFGASVLYILIQIHMTLQCYLSNPQR